MITSRRFLEAWAWIMMGSVVAASPPAPVQNDAKNWPLFRGDSSSRAVAATTLADQPELLWEFSVPNGAFESTPVVADGFVYAADLDGNVYALELATGQKRWQYQTGSSFQASPAVWNKRLYIGDVDGKFHCVDVTSGKQVWVFEAQAEIDGSANFYGTRVLFGSQDATLYCLDAADGKLVWKHSIADQIRCTPTIIEGRAFVAGCDSRLHVIDVETGMEERAVDIEAPTGVTPAASGQRVYFGTEGATFFCIQWVTGEILWKYQLPESGQSIRSSPCLNDRAVVFGGRDKRIHALDPLSGRSLWTLETKARVDCSPVLVGSRVFCGAADGRLYALELASGRILWQTELRGGVNSGMAVADGRLIVATDAGRVYCFGAKSRP
jgi:outer membrane protein assembly factor BamB